MSKPLILQAKPQFCLLRGVLGQQKCITMIINTSTNGSKPYNISILAVDVLLIIVDNINKIDHSIWLECL